MGFLNPPKPPTPPPAPNTAVQAQQPRQSTAAAPIYSSLISTSSQGLKRKAYTQKVSLIGGG